MSDPSDSFLARWSKRKLETKAPPAPAVEQTPPAGSDQASPSDHPDKPFDPQSLPLPVPDLSDIVAGFDMRPFLQKGVPESLKNAALRKLWHLDPAITEFVSPALDYAHDYNRPETIAGFGSLTSDHDLKDLLHNLFSTPQQTEVSEESRALPAGPEGKEDLAESPSETPETQAISPSEAETKPAASLPVIRTEAAEMVQNEHTKQEPYPILSDKKSQFKRHGSALPE